MRIIKKVAHFIKRCLQFIYYSLFKQGTFWFNGDEYNYFYHLMNVTFSNERAIEIPIAAGLLDQYKDKWILEVGNVMHWYHKSKHIVLDKYEKNCINEDIVDYQHIYKFDLVLSVSTLEHVGYDEVPHDSEKIYKSIENMKTLLRPGGLLFFTIPVGYNPNIDFQRIGNLVDLYYLQWENGYEIAVGYYYLQA